MRPDPETPCTLTLTARLDGAAVPGMRFALYRAAELDGLGHWALTAEFAPSGADLGALNAAQDLAAAADAFARFVSAEHLVPCAAETTDAQGAAAFSGLVPGLYLVTADAAVSGGWEYRCAPALLALPALGSDGASWDYDAAALPKIERSALPDPPAPVPEPTPAPTPSPQPPPEPTEAPVPSPEPSVTPTPTPARTGKPSGADETLPQTGQLRWPVPVLAVLGLALAAAGIGCRRRRDE